MKKQYTKKQICEAIAYWKKQLNESTQFNHKVQEVLDAFANMTPEQTEGLRQLVKRDYDQHDQYSIDDFIGPGLSFIDIDGVLDNIEDIDLNNEYHVNFQYCAMDVISAAEDGDKATANTNARKFTDYLKRYCSEGEFAVQGWQSHINEPMDVLMALYDILDEKFNLRNYSVDYTAWHMDKYTVDIKARSKEEVKRKFFKDHAHEEYDMKDFEITSIKEK